MNTTTDSTFAALLKEIGETASVSPQTSNMVYIRKLAQQALAALHREGEPKAEVDWKAALDEQTQQFQRETMRTSKQARLLLRWVRDAHDRGCRNDNVGNKCGQCDLMRETEALLEMPINAHPAAEYTEEEGEAYMSGWFDGNENAKKALQASSVVPAEPVAQVSVAEEKNV